jgi:hypothetical protein
LLSGFQCHGAVVSISRCDDHCIYLGQQIARPGEKAQVPVLRGAPAALRFLVSDSHERHLRMPGEGR